MLSRAAKTRRGKTGTVGGDDEAVAGRASTDEGAAVPAGWGARTGAALRRGRAWFRAFRRTRPFWGGVWMVAGGWTVLKFSLAPMQLIVSTGFDGIAGYLLGGGVVLSGLTRSPRRSSGTRSASSARSSRSSRWSPPPGRVPRRDGAGVLGGSMMVGWGPSAPPAPAAGPGPRPRCPRSRREAPARPACAVGGDGPRRGGGLGGRAGPGGRGGRVAVARGAAAAGRRRAVPAAAAAAAGDDRGDGGQVDAGQEQRDDPARRRQHAGDDAVHVQPARGHRPREGGPPQGRRRPRGHHRRARQGRSAGTTACSSRRRP
ncbi:DUF6114 domain-containing protein [Streptomyces sp. NPDC058374]|uniref:DUF6114 domain-containing protein n=1 Tax=Streptomyces sp. NPDC058374 TaxID=3346466 RepID=UPI003664DDDF